MEDNMIKVKCIKCGMAFWDGFYMAELRYAKRFTCNRCLNDKWKVKIPEE